MVKQSFSACSTFPSLHLAPSRLTAHRHTFSLAEPRGRTSDLCAYSAIDVSRCTETQPPCSRRSSRPVVGDICVSCCFCCSLALQSLCWVRALISDTTLFYFGPLAFVLLIAHLERLYSNLVRVEYLIWFDSLYFELASENKENMIDEKS